MRRLFRIFLLLLALFFGVLSINTIGFSSKQIPVDPTDSWPVEDAVFTRLSKAIQAPSITTAERIDSSAFYQLDILIKQSFPLVDSFLELTTINSFSRLYQWPGKNPKLNPILLMAHLDVVPIEEESKTKWTKPPFSGHIGEEYIWGRGAMDDKSSIFGILEAIEILLTQGYNPERTVYLAFGHDEEISGQNGAEAIVAHLQNKGVQFEYILDEGQMIIQDALSSLDSPLAMIGIGEKGYTTMHLEVALEEGGHSAMPPRESAIGILSTAIKRLQDQPLPAKIDGATAEMFNYIGPEMSLPYKVLFANLWCTRGLLKGVFNGSPTTSAMIRTTTAPTIINGGVKDNVLPTVATAKVNFRILPGETVQSVQQFVEKTIGDPRVKVEASDGSSDPPPLSGTNTFGYGVIQKSIQEVFPDVVVSPALTIATTDSRHYTELSPNIYRFMPIHIPQSELDGIHGVDERLSKQNYKQMIRFYYQLIVNSCK